MNDNLEIGRTRIYHQDPRIALMKTASQQLELDRKGLLSLTAKNRLLSLPLNDPRAKFLTFEAADEDTLLEELAVHSKEIHFTSGTRPQEPYHSRRVSCHLPSVLSGSSLQAKLLSLSKDAKTAIEERGINILHLTLGMVSWTDDKRKSHQAPLILLPVKLVRGRNSKLPFTLRWSEEEIELNPCLELKIKQELDIDLPSFGQDETKSPVSEYFRKIAGLLKKAKEWNVSSGTVGLGLFDFTKLLMYRDLDPEKWPSPDDLLTPSVRSLLGDSAGMIRSDIHPNLGMSSLEATAHSRRDHVMDADESQSKAITMVRNGVDLIIQGPPGTGKSQTIANIIATAVLDGKSVLFVCEKSAALDVVKRRLEHIGLGSLCLELHSGKATKKAVLAQIQSAWEEGLKHRATLRATPTGNTDDFSAALDALASDLNRPLIPSGLTPHDIMGRLAVITSSGRNIPRIAINGLQDFSPENFHLALQSAQELQSAYNSITDPRANPWSAVERTIALHHADIINLGKRIRELMDLLRTFGDSAAEIASSMGYAPPEDLITVQGLLQLAGTIMEMPPSASACTVPREQEPAQQLTDLVAQLADLSAVWKPLADVLQPAILDPETHLDCDTLRTYGDAFFRYVMPSWWEAMGTLRKHALKPLPEDQGALLELFVSLSRCRELAMKVLAGGEIGKQAFGPLWNGIGSDPAELRRILDWHSSLHERGVDDQGVTRLAPLTENRAFRDSVSNLWESLRRDITEIESLFAFLETTATKALGTASLEESSFAQLLEILTSWEAHLPHLTTWIRWRAALDEAHRSGLAPLADAMIGGRMPGAQAVSALQNSYYRDLLESAEKERPSLAQFRAERHESMIGTFRSSDEEAIRRASRRVLEAYLSRLPELDSIREEIQFLKREIHKSRKHHPVRTLLGRSGNVLRTIKPVFMMSPLTAAQYLEPGSAKFDLLVIDEASQIPPVDALGSIARSKQHVVVGDSRQLPPTSFFSKMITDEDPDSDEEFQVGETGAGDMESILSLCAARHFSQTMLRWHFRSRHETLIGFSNRRFYGGNLVVAPSPDRNPARRGLRHIHVPDGVYTDRENRTEAERIAQEVLEHSRKSPELTLGIVTFSQKQQLLVEECINDLAESHPCLAEFRSAHGDESLFVKNIENVQGDERDVIFISFGYARDHQGTFAMRFGPAGQSGGERRLNVMITRSKERCVLFSSVKSSDFRLEAVKADSPVHAIREFMEFAERCTVNPFYGMSRHETQESSSSLASEIRHTLQGHGLNCRELPGANGIHIDLAIEDPRDPTRLLMALLLDGPGYASFQSARDRDRLFHSILRSNGWDKTRRVWSQKWLTDPEGETSLILEMLGKVLETHTDPTIRNTAVSSENKYTVAGKSPGLPTFHRITPNQLADEILKILRIESPMHPMQLNERIKQFFDIPRLDEATKGRILNSVAILEGEGKCKALEECLGTPETTIKIRNRSHLTPKPAPELIPEPEIRLAAESVINSYPGNGDERLARAAAGLLGYSQENRTLSERLLNQIRKIKGEARVRLDADLG